MFSSRPKVVAPKIVHHGSGINPAWWIVAIVLLAGWTWVVYDFSHNDSFQLSLSDNQQVETLKNRVALLNKKIEQIRLQAASYQRSAQIDRSAAMLAREDLKQNMEELAELKREVEFLTGLLTDKDKKAVLRARHFSISSGTGSQSFFVEFTLLQLSKVGGKVSGAVELEVSGMQAGKPSVLTLEKITTEKLKTLKMGFKNFQNFKQEINLPKDFEPGQLTIRAIPTGKVVDKLEISRPWQLTAG